ncbi:MAG: LysE family transporter [Thermoplasmata archaeon]
MIDALAFLAFVFVISLSGVLMPGPMTAATVARSYSDKWAGAKVAVGHAVIEFPLLAVITAIVISGGEGLSANSSLMIAIGLLGGTYLLALGGTMLKEKEYVSDESDSKKLSKNAIVLGITTTALNPGFVLWWVAIGAIIVSQALQFGILMIPIFAAVHWSCDFFWGLGLSFGIQKAKQYYASRIKEIIRIGCAILIIVFGILFLVNSILQMT